MQFEIFTYTHVYKGLEIDSHAMYIILYNPFESWVVSTDLKAITGHISQITGSASRSLLPCIEMFFSWQLLV